MHLCSSTFTTISCLRTERYKLFTPGNTYCLNTYFLFNYVFVIGKYLQICIPIICKQDLSDYVIHRVAVVGNVDAGKSTLLGVLTHGELDNGRGHARQKLFRHKHEMESGRTSSVGNDILGFDSEGHVVNKPEGHGKN